MSCSRFFFALSFNYPYFCATYYRTYYEKNSIFFLGLNALFIIQACTKEFTNGGKDTIEYQYIVENNTDESIVLNIYNPEKTSIIGLRIPGRRTFNIGDFPLSESDSLDVVFDSTKHLRLYSAHYLYTETEITPDYDNCFNKYISKDEQAARKILSVDYKMKSFSAPYSGN